LYHLPTTNHPLIIAIHPPQQFCDIGLENTPVPSSKSRRLYLSRRSRHLFHTTTTDIPIDERYEHHKPDPRTDPGPATLLILRRSINISRSLPAISATSTGSFNLIYTTFASNGPALCTSRVSSLGRWLFISPQEMQRSRVCYAPTSASIIVYPGCNIGGCIVQKSHGYHTTFRSTVGTMHREQALELVTRKLFLPLGTSSSPIEIGSLRSPLLLEL
jgi:hypothetical protein